MPNLEQVFNEARQRVLRGEQLTIEEQKNLIALLRAGRSTAAEAGASARTTRKATKAKTTGVSDEDLDAQLGDLGL